MSERQMVWLGNFSSIKPSSDGRSVCVRVFTEFEVNGRIVHVNLLQTEVPEVDRAVAHELIADALATEETAVRDMVYTEYIRSFKVEDPRTTFGNAAQAA